MALYLDKKDLLDIESVDKYVVTDELIDMLRSAREYPCNQVLYYKLKDLEVIQKWKSMNFYKAYWLISVNLHPVWSFYRKFDF